jgi:8-oxo-dGTP pyrophosphatase MutT (NUDIX family)
VTDRFRVVPAAYLILRRGDEILLQLRANTGYRDGYWAVGAAGHVEAGESVFEAAVREAREEVGVRVEVTDLEALTAMHRTHANGRPVDERVDFFFSCRRWAGEPRRLEEHKSADLAWFPLTALPDPVVPHERVVLDGLRSGTLPAVVTYGFR